MARMNIKVFVNDTWTHRIHKPMLLLPDTVSVSVGAIEIEGSPDALRHLARALADAAAEGEQVFKAATADGTRG